MDSDDSLLPHSIWRRVFVSEENSDPAVAGAFCSVIPAPDCGKSLRVHLAPFRRVQEEWIDFITSAGECPFTIHAPLIRTDILQEFGGFNNTWRYAEDWQLWLRILRHGYIFLPSCHYGGVYRQDAESKVHRTPSRHCGESLSLIDIAYSDLPQEEILKNVPYVFKQPLSYYQRTLVEARRLIGFAMMACLAGDQGFSEIVRTLKPKSGFYVTRHLDIDALLETAINRFFCLKASAGKNPEIRARKRQVYEAIATQIGLPSSNSACCPP